jgi:hypothetical protein
VKKFTEEYGPYVGFWVLILVVMSLVSLWTETYRNSLPLPREKIIYVHEDRDEKYPHLYSKEEGYKEYKWPYESKIPKLFLIKSGMVCEITPDMITEQ